MFLKKVVTLARRGYGPLKQNISSAHPYSTSSTPQVVIADGGRTIVCWHPEPAFPYEHSVPLPEEMVKEISVIKSVNSTGLHDVRHLENMKEELAREQLMKMTSTNKHRWFPVGNRKLKRRKSILDRPYL